HGCKCPFLHTNSVPGPKGIVRTSKPQQSAAERTGSIARWARWFDAKCVTTERALVGLSFRCSRGNSHVFISPEKHQLLKPTNSSNSADRRVSILRPGPHISRSAYHAPVSISPAGQHIRPCTGEPRQGCQSQGSGASHPPIRGVRFLEACSAPEPQR